MTIAEVPPTRIGLVPMPQSTVRAPRQTLVIPTYNERDNVVGLLSRLAQILPAADTEIVFVDDSTDDTPEVIRAAARQCPIPITVHHRDRHTGGLGGAVVEGCRMARGTWIVVMDGDLQHPPEVVPDLVSAGVRDGADLVVASRYAAGGSRGGLSGRFRRLVSGGSRLATKLFFRTALVRVGDPLSGFFAVRRSCLDLDALRPIGYKILLELVVRNRPGRVIEVGYAFRPRLAGESKATFQEGLRFLSHLAVLRAGQTRLRLFGYGLIGLSGLLPNSLALWLLSGVLGLHYLPSAVLATQVAVGWNFVLTDLLFRGRRSPRRLLDRLSRFALLGNVDLLLRVSALALLVDQAGVHYLEANLVTIVMFFLARFLVVDRIIYRRDQPASRQPALDLA